MVNVLKKIKKVKKKKGNLSAKNRQYVNCPECTIRKKNSRILSGQEDMTRRNNSVPGLQDHQIFSNRQFGSVQIHGHIG